MARLEAGGWRLEVEQADITDDFSALDAPVWGDVFKLDGTMTKAAWTWFDIRRDCSVKLGPSNLTLPATACMFQKKRNDLVKSLGWFCFE